VFVGVRVAAGQLNFCPLSLTITLFRAEFFCYVLSFFLTLPKFFLLARKLLFSSNTLPRALLLDANSVSPPGSIGPVLVSRDYFIFPGPRLLSRRAFFPIFVDTLFVFLLNNHTSGVHCPFLLLCADLHSFFSAASRHSVGPPLGATTPLSLAHSVRDISGHLVTTPYPVFPFPPLRRFWPLFPQSLILFVRNSSVPFSVVLFFARSSRGLLSGPLLWLFSLRLVAYPLALRCFLLRVAPILC